ncbi:hypothetical protein O185_18030 [Photorhabdus temperata J3]|uniref:Uncharacterized protein n=1 Tax=Photorhabdus temperata J3 TaxID=1389415 RepID=U7QZ88_PHOTE|nr:hypothetical protein O185_18030 [Photorhabdus temperata J3]
MEKKKLIAVFKLLNNIPDINQIVTSIKTVNYQLIAVFIY